MGIKEKRRDLYEISYGDKWTIPLSDYENRSPLVHIKQTVSKELTETELTAIFKKISLLADIFLLQKRHDILSQNISERLKEIRFYTRNGKKYPSVTSIINMGEKLRVPNIELYSLRGDILHRIFERWVKGKKLVYDITQEEQDRLKPIGGLKPKEFDLTWITKLKYKFCTAETEVYQDEFLYAGKYDAKGKVLSKVPGPEKAVFDLKSGKPSKDLIEKAFMQLAAYARCLEKIKYLIILPVHPKATKEAIVTENIDDYFNKFLQKRSEFKTKFGV